MAYLAKSTVLKAYQLLSEIDSDKRQGLTQKVSALKYASALDIYFKMHNQNCDLKQSSNRDLFASYVGEIVKINDEYCTKDFFLSVSSNGRDFDCGSNFFSQTSVKDSKTNPYTVFSYPKRSGWQPVMDVQNQELIYRSDYLLDVFSFYLGSSELRLAFIIWILRFTEIAENNVDGIKSALNNMYTTDYCGALYTDSVNSVDTSYIEFDDEMCQLSCEDIQSLFNSVKGNSREESFSLNFPLQQIFYGAPGTGKSHKIDEKTNDNNSIRTTFHPDTDYATFVGAYKPMMDVVDEYALDATGKTHKIEYPNGKSSIIYKYEPQVFLKAYVEAWKRYLNKQEGKNDSYYLVIEEINRGNCAQIFGDLFQLLDRENNGFSGYAISPESAITKYLAEEAQSADGTKFSDLVFSDVIKKREDGATKIIATADDLKAGKRLVLPPNLHIWATMNTSDQSLFPIDSAFKRRWDWKYIPIDYNKETWSIVAKGASYSWSDFLKKMNNLVASTTDSEDKMLGFYFAKAKDGIIDADTFVGKVVFYLWNDVFKDYGLPKEILNGAESKEFAFRNFFNVDGSANEDVVKRLLDNLEIKIAGSNENETYIENDDIDAGKAEHKETLVAVTINGERLTADDITQFDLYLNAIKKIGVNRIGPALEAMKYRRKGSPMATKDPVQSLLESDNYSYVKVDGYYFVKGANGYTLVRILEDLNTSLNLNIQIEYR